MYRPWLHGRISRSIETIHGAYVRQAWRRASPLRRGLFIATSAIWPLILIALAVKQTLEISQIATTRNGKSAFRQLVEQVQIGLLALLLPKHYYIFELFEDHLRAQCGNYLLRSQTKRGVYKVLIDRALPKPVRSPFKDKQKFSDQCRAAGIPTAETLLVFRDGRVIMSTETDTSLQRCDLFIKPITGQGGRGAEKWIYLNERWQDGSRSFGEVDLLLHCRERSKRDGLMMQRALSNHSAFAGLALGALATLRVMTIIDEHGTPEAHFAVLRMPSKHGVVVDNFHAGGIAAAINMETGIVGKATNIGLSRSTEWHTHHPVTGNAIEGMTVPFFADAIAVALRAHKIFSNAITVGWDVAVCEIGPMIVEANGFPDLDIIQRTYRMPLGGTRFAALLAFHVARRTDPSFR
jgi:hypothetical protein